MKLPSEIRPCTYRSSSRLAALPAVASLFLFGSGCTNVGVMQQRLLSKPNMTFADSAVFDYGVATHATIEPGTSGSGAAQASGCTACK